MDEATAREKHAYNLAWRTWERMAPPENGHVDREALRGAAMLGAAKALERFDPTRGVKFSSFAISYIRGEIREEMRAQDHLSRSLRQEAKRIEAITGEYPRWADRPLFFEELHREGEFSELSLLDLISTEDDTEAAALEEIGDEHAEIYDAIALLPRREARAIGAYYYGEATNREVGERLGVCESRAHQIRDDALHHLRKFLGVEAPEPEWHLLTDAKIAEAVARHGFATDAARELGITASAVNRRMRRIRDRARKAA